MLPTIGLFVAHFLSISHLTWVGHWTFTTVLLWWPEHHVQTVRHTRNWLWGLCHPFHLSHKSWLYDSVCLQSATCKGQSNWYFIIMKSLLSFSKADTFCTCTGIYHTDILDTVLVDLHKNINFRHIFAVGIWHTDNLYKL